MDKENINDNPEMIDLSSNSDSEEIEDDDPEELVVPEEELFLKANFESLSASLADEVFQQLGSESKGRHHLSPGRPSISTLYLFKSRSNRKICVNVHVQFHCYCWCCYGCCCGWRWEWAVIHA